MTNPFPQLDDTIFVSPQIQLSDIDHITKMGIKTVICHRPEHELSPAEPNFVTLQAVLTKHGIDMIYQPIQQVSTLDIEQLDGFLTNCEHPVLMYCRSGTRSALLWALRETMVNQRDRAEVLAAAGAAGYDLSGYLL